MMKRTYIKRKCPKCLKIESVRKDGVGVHCRKCRAIINSENAKPKNILNEKFGKLTALKLSHISKSAFWECLCECGKYCIIAGYRLRNGTTKSCGCIVSTQKGMSKSASYRSWRSMIQRCYDEKVSHYKRYGAKGIKVCDEWKNSFQNFLEDMGERPKGKTLDRIDPNGNYETDNCRWCTPKQQGNNKNTNFFIECFNKTQTLTEWADEYSIKWSTLRKRILGLKWPIEKALTKKVGKYASS